MLSNKSSQIIDLYRFPLAVLVVFIHFTGRGEMAISATDLREVSGYDVYSFIRIFFSRVLSQVTVPVFFLISGYLFFHGLDEWSWSIWRKKVKKRIHSLLVPYILWITLYVLYTRILHSISGGGNFSLYDILCSKWHIIGYYYNCIYADTTNISWAGTASPTCCPIFIPFWFIRDLMFMVALSPLIFFLLKKFQKLFVIFLLLAYVSQIWPVVPGLSIRAVCFFSIGGFLAMHSCSIPRVLVKSSYAATFFLAMLCSLNYNSRLYWLVLPWFVLSACFMLYDVGDILVRKHVRVPVLLVKSTFFIFAFHVFFLDAWRECPHDEVSLLRSASEYFLVPIIVVSLSVVAYYVLNRWCYRVANVLGCR